MMISDLVRTALLDGGIVSLSSTIYAEDINNGIQTANNLIAEWQINRWLVYDLVNVAIISTAAASYTVGPGGAFNFNGVRPDKIDAVFVSASGQPDIYLYPFMSREGYDRSQYKNAAGTPLTFYYDPALGALGTLYFAPVPSVSYTLNVNAKATLQTFAAPTDAITLPTPYVNALTWTLARDLRTLYRMPIDALVAKRAQDALDALVNSIGQVPQAVMPAPSERAGIFSANQSPAQIAGQAP